MEKGQSVIPQLRSKRLGEALFWCVVGRVVRPGAQKGPGGKSKSSQVCSAAT